ncbi:hypothetical protein JKI49_001795 [Salmonella enterica]|nr:hypothetical protein [Salmonella enterica]EGC3460736.1 hypothetical protein [Salmonella enterica subsp. enterica serovar Baildon]EEC5106287.1 hypothetical protein [Salmonella enterica]EEC5914682.1 hypothetical protein [Salmonella enterica]EEC6340257.1 hypothetical protein [Salmonella enterica]
MTASVFPAPAGINRITAEHLEELFGVPRASGDKPPARVAGVPMPPCSPRQRG